MESPLDSSEVIRMRKNFDAFISDRGSRFDQPTLRMNLDEMFSAGVKRQYSSSHPQSLQTSSADSVKAVLEKEKQEKLRRAELLTAQSKIAELEAQLASTKTSNKRARIEFEKDLDTAKSGRERESEKISELRSKIRQLAESEQMAKSAMAEAQQDWEKERLVLETKLRSVQKERITLENDLHKVKDESGQKVMELQQEARRCLTELELNLIELEETKEQQKIQKGRLEELTTQLAEFESLKQKAVAAEEKVKELEEQISRQAEDATVNRALRADIEKVPGLETELARLRTENEYHRQQKQNVLLLREQLTSAQRKLEGAERNNQALTQLQVEHEDLKLRLQRWETMDTSGSRRPQSPSELSRRVTELQAAEALSLEQNGKLKSSIRVLEQQLHESRNNQQKTQRELATQQEQMKQNGEHVKRIRRKLLLVSKERDSFKRILDSYESEMTVPVPANSRVKELEESLAGYQQVNTELESQIDQLSELHQQATARCLQLEQQCESAQTGSGTATKATHAEIAYLQEKMQELEQALKKATNDKEILEMRIEQRHLQGDYDPTHTKVVHFSMNPAAIAQQQRQQEMERLKEENERLTARVKLLENAGGLVEDLTLQVDKQLETVPESKAIEELKTQLAKEELRKQRLVEAFKKTSQEFRETCYQLLGYKIDMPCTGQYRLASMYSDSPHDYLLFKQGQSGEIQMLQTDFSSRQQDKLETYLQNRDSIPALLSAITLELFNQQTLNLG